MTAATQSVVPPLPPESLDALSRIARPLTDEQRLWASGFLAGMAHRETSTPSVVAAAPDPAAQSTWTVLFAGETGNSRRIAERLAQRLQDAGAASRIADMAEYRAVDLKRERRLIAVVATHGLGDPPEGCEPFFEFLGGARAPKLHDLQFAVLALGDSTYDDFCSAGRELDQRLANLGAERLFDRVECDTDFEDQANAFSEHVLDLAGSLLDEPAAAPATPHLVAVPPLQFERDRPFAADVLVNQKITASESTKDVRHVELSLQGSGLRYEPGDALGVWPRNGSVVVRRVVDLAGLSGDEQVDIGGATQSIAEALTDRLELSQTRASFLEGYAKLAGSEELTRLIADADQRLSFLKSHQVVDVLNAFPTRLPAQTLANTLPKITPRLYSIASSPLVAEDEVHLAVRLLQTRSDRFGTTSQLLRDEPNSLRVYVEPNPRFRLPQDPHTPVIMIGPGTGVAPFRAFMQQRELEGAHGPSWLFFGDRSLRSDFLYQLEWRRMLKRGVLQRLDVAFSRDQHDKFYVQHRLREHATALFDWLENGATVYVCGDMHRMAPDVHEALVSVATRGLGKDTEAGAAYLDDLKRAGRYRRDIY